MQTPYLKKRLREDFGVNDVDVIPIGFEEHLDEICFDPTAIVPNRVLWIGRDEPNRRPDLPIEYARQNPGKEVAMVLGGERYRDSMRKYDLPLNVKLKFALTRRAGDGGSVGGVA